MKTLLFSRQFFLFLLMASCCASTFAEEDTGKKWEIGIGIGSISGPDYRGSKTYRNYTKPIPYVIYRGKYLRSDRDGIRGQFLNFDNVQFTFSAGASITPNTADNTLRQGMPELGSTIELGPSINVQLSGDELQNGWQLQLPWRAVYAVGGDSNQFIGSVFQPQIIYRERWNKWSYSYRIGVMFADENYHDYYYSVDAQYAMQNRPAFSAQGGYSGWNNQFSINRALTINATDTRIAFFVRYDNLEGTNFNDSPLMETNNVLRGGIAFIWVFK